MKLAEFSVKNSLLVNVFSAFLIIAGLIGVFRLTREAFPNVSFDMVVVQTAYPGSTPYEMEKLITIPIEEELKEVDDIDEMQSVSAEGISVISLKIEEDAPNKDRVVNEIQRAVDRVDNLPADLEDKPGVREIRTKDNPVIGVSLSGSLSENKLQDYAKGLEKRFLDIKGVAKVVRDGWRDRQIWVEIKPETMEALHISLSEVAEALKKQNISFPGGSLYDKKGEYIIRTTGEFATPEEVGDVVIRGNVDGNWVRVRDVADVHYDFEEEKIITKTNGSRAVNLTIVKKASGDILKVVDGVRKIVDEFKTGADPELKISFLNDLSFYVKRRLNVLISNGWIGLILVLVSLFTFLSFRVAVGAAIGIPTAILTTFAVMSWMGISINLLTMFGMIMVIGMLVDEDIVISENIHRHLQEGKSNEEATILGAGEVGRSVIATVATTLAAFIPLYLMSGIMGKFIRNIPIIVNITLIASLIEALFILPSHLSDLTRKIHTDRIQKNKHLRERRFYQHMLALYEKTLGTCLKHRYRFSAVSLLLLVVVGLNAIYRMPFVLFPSRGIEIFFIKVEGEPADTVEVTEKKFDPIEKIVASLPKNELDNFVTQIGIVQQDPDDPYTDRGTHLGQVIVYLTPERQRDRTAEEIIGAIRPEIEKASTFKKLSFERVHPGPPVGRDVEVRIRGEDFSILNRLAEKYIGALQKIDGVNDLQSDYRPGKTEIRVLVDREKAAQVFLTPADVATAVRNAFEGMVATTIKKSDEEIEVVVKFPVAYRWKREALDELLIPNRLGNLIPLNKIGTLKEEKGLEMIKHFDGLRSVSVTANLDETRVTPLRLMQRIGHEMKDILLPYPGYAVHYGGQNEETRESLGSLFNALYIALGLIFIIMIAMFRSISQSLIILVTIPFGLIGVVIGLEMHGFPLSFMAMLGMVGLAGIVCDSGLIMIDFINNSRKRGADKMKSIMEGSLLRFRAILLTTLTTVLGVLPSAYGIGGNDPFIQPMALAMNYGLVVGAFLSLFLVPCLMAITDDLHGVYARYFGNGGEKV